MMRWPVYLPVLVELCTHEWIDITAIDSERLQFICALCSDLQTRCRPVDIHVNDTHVGDTS